MDAINTKQSAQTHEKASKKLPKTWAVVLEPGLETQALHSLYTSFDQANAKAKKMQKGGDLVDVMRLVDGRLTAEY
jgi:uncharacterized membrane protein YkoI